MSYENPYAAPVEIAQAPGMTAAPFAAAGELRIASQGKRFANLIIDRILTMVLANGAGVVLGMIYGLSVVANGRALSPDDEFLLNMMGYALGLTVAVGYYILTEAVFQCSVGKLVTGTRVVNESGGRATFGQIIGRSFARLIPFEAFSFLGGNKPVGWHDKLSGTRVIEVR
ncbi:MAG: RDD family protein [Planctomycetales bacterium]|nr:RDD family protein [Planctomycetales bacterium]